MANIHRIGDNPPPPPANNNNNNNPMGLQLPFTQQAQTTNPTGENFWDMLKSSICPVLTWKSGTVLLFLILSIFYVISLEIGPLGELLMSPSTESLISMGAISPTFIKQKQFWRFLTSPFLNSNILIFALNQFMILCLGANIEPLVSTKGLLFGYFFSGVEGGLITCALVEPQTLFITSNLAFQGIFGLLIAFVIINWQTFEAFGPMRAQLVCLIGLLVVFALLGGSFAIVLGTLFSMIMGVFIGLWAIKPLRETDYEKKCNIIGLVSAIFLLFTSLFIFLEYL